MLRMIMTGALVAMVMAAGTARACEACAALFKERQRHQGKLIREVTDDFSKPLPLDPFDRMPRLPIAFERWVLKTADGKAIALTLGSRTVTRLAQALVGTDVVVTGPLKDGVIDVRDIEAVPAVFTGVLKLVEEKGRPAVWKLVTGKGELDVYFAETAAKEAAGLAGKSVVIKGRLTNNGVLVTSAEVIALAIRSPFGG